MSEERFDRLEKMMELVLKEITVMKSAMATKDDVAGLNTKIDSLDSKVASLDSKVESYGQAQQEDVYGLLKILDKKLTDLSEDIKSVAQVTGEHEIRIRTLTRRPV